MTATETRAEGAEALVAERVAQLLEENPPDRSRRPSSSVASSTWVWHGFISPRARGGLGVGPEAPEDGDRSRRRGRRTHRRHDESDRLRHVRARRARARHRLPEGRCCGRCSPTRTSGVSSSPSPGAGSDVASLACRAERDGDQWIAQRPEGVDDPRPHLADGVSSSPEPTPRSPSTEGLTAFIVDMEAPGVEVRPLRQITGEAEFNEVYFTDVDDPRFDARRRRRSRLGGLDHDADERAGVDRRRNPATQQRSDRSTHDGLGGVRTIRTSCRARPVPAALGARRDQPADQHPGISESSSRAHPAPRVRSPRSPWPN